MLSFCVLWQHIRLSLRHMQARLGDRSDSHLNGQSDNSRFSMTLVTLGGSRLSIAFGARMFLKTFIMGNMSRFPSLM